MTNIATTFPIEAAIFLANRYYDFTEEVRPKAREIAKGRFDGACGALHAVGYGWTPSHVHAIVQEACHANGPRPIQTAYPTDRKAHQERVAAAIVAGFAEAAA